MDRLRIGSRGSPLAVIQVDLAIKAWQRAHGDTDFERIIIKTDGDREGAHSSPHSSGGSGTDSSAHSGSDSGRNAGQTGGGKASFVTQIEQALVDGRIDCAVHSIKDMPSRLAPSCRLGAVLEREQSHDVLIGRGLGPLCDLAGKRIGTSSPRRAALLRHWCPDVDVVPLRGNVGTRLAKMDQGMIDGTVLAFAGIKRLGMEDRIAMHLDPEVFLPAPCQGAIGIECLYADRGLLDKVMALDHPRSRFEIDAERAMLKALNANCDIPVGAWSSWDGAKLVVRGMVASRDGRRVHRHHLCGLKEQAKRMGGNLGRKLKSTKVLSDDRTSAGAV